MCDSRLEEEDAYYAVAEGLVTWCPAVTRKAELTSGKTKEISKWSAQGAGSRFLLLLTVKCKRGKLRKVL